MELLSVLDVLALAQQRLLREILATFLEREHGAVFPISPELALSLELVLEFLFIGDRGGDPLLGRGQLLLHVEQRLLDHLLRVFRATDQGIEVRFQDRPDALEHSHWTSFPRATWRSPTLTFAPDHPQRCDLRLHGRFTV